MSLPSIAVVVPFFQREPGLLARALSSVAAQNFQPRQVIVVDDGSPIAAAAEIASGQLEAKLPRLTQVMQTNQGVSAARNAGLAKISPDIDAVAFLDSDDSWDRQHLQYASEALRSGADVFFANFRRPDTPEIHDGFSEPMRSHLQAPGGPLVRWTQGVPALMRASCPIMTSSVVYRRSILPDLRFARRLRRAGEDHIAFWELCLRASSIVYCTEVTWTYGDGGVGIWRNCPWGSMEYLVMRGDEIRLLRYVERHFPVDPAARAEIAGALRRRREMTLSAALHLARRDAGAYAEIGRLLLDDPGCAVTWAKSLPGHLRDWMTSRAS